MAPPKKWDDEDDDSSSEESVEAPKPVTVAARRKFDDEEDSDDVASNWEEDDSDVEREKAAKAEAAKAKAAAEAAANKKSKSQRIEEHRDAKMRQKLAEEEESSDEEESAADKRARLRQTEQEADLKHAQDLFGDVDIGSKKRAPPPKAVVIEDKENPGQAIDLSSIPLFRPSTKGQFEALSQALVPLLLQSSTKPHYPIWVANFVKQICTDIPSTEIKKAASGLTALSNEKMKEEKSRDGTGKKSKAAKQKTSLAAGRDVGRGVADTTSYDDGLAEDDFM